MRLQLARRGSCISACAKPKHAWPSAADPPAPRGPFPVRTHHSVFSRVMYAHQKMRNILKRACPMASLCIVCADPAYRNRCLMSVFPDDERMQSHFTTHTHSSLICCCTCMRDVSSPCILSGLPPSGFQKTRKKKKNGSSLRRCVTCPPAADARPRCWPRSGVDPGYNSVRIHVYSLCLTDS